MAKLHVIANRRAKSGELTLQSNVPCQQHFTGKSVYTAMFKRSMKGLGMLLKAEAILWVMMAVLAGIVSLVSKIL